MDNPFAPDYREPELFEAPRDEPKAKPRTGHITIHNQFEQGSEQWLQARCGLLTASEMKHVITAKTLKSAQNDKATAHLYELLAQRITGYVEPHYVSDDMLRGQEDEILARAAYAEHYEPVEEIGFITNNRWGFTLGYSPDGKIVGKKAGIEGKSRRQKYQIQTLVEHVLQGTIPDDYVIQCQTGLLVAEWEWIDFLSYCGGLHMPAIRVYPDPVIQDAIVNAAGEFERRLSEKLKLYHEALASNARLVATERREEEEIVI
ncbi:conserved hypothetical protein [Sphingobium sp. SYK-6]|uniref:YqaJ viral recombinase family protein n=1 Tax=Sphingobium sp. (strain NBRC 103272 / SYK-6) TaxID=627192 RepID=UPI00022770A4|nr:YqaJ viral recombinase family protein [Sphingobium sp. SYK-6]BAK66844.1 conserved hypothetical protein [Sphingobium sp. SYK-6]